MTSVFLIILAYLIGAIPSAYIFTVKIKGVDIREIGSGNVGATNAARALGLKYGIIVALLDILKGFLAVSLVYFLMGNNINQSIVYLSGLAVIIGHDFSVFLKFNGGKGVATSVGVILGLEPIILLFLVIIWFLIAVITRYISLASVLSALILPAVAYLISAETIAILFFLVFGLLIVISHHENISRLIKGTENKFGRSDG